MTSISNHRENKQINKLGNQIVILEECENLKSHEIFRQHINVLVNFINLKSLRKCFLIPLGKN